jgi:uncharacterized protein with PIN domain
LCVPHIIGEERAMSAAIHNCPKCKQPMRWHSSNRAKALDDAMETDVFRCGRCERYLARERVATAAIHHDCEKIEPVAA